MKGRAGLGNKDIHGFLYSRPGSGTCYFHPHPIGQIQARAATQMPRARECRLLVCPGGRPRKVPASSCRTSLLGGCRAITGRTQIPPQSPSALSPPWTTSPRLTPGSWSPTWCRQSLVPLFSLCPSPGPVCSYNRLQWLIQPGDQVKSSPRRQIHLSFEGSVFESSQGVRNNYIASL